MCFVIYLDECVLPNIFYLNILPNGFTQLLRPVQGKKTYTLKNKGA